MFIVLFPMLILAAYWLARKLTNEKGPPKKRRERRQNIFATGGGDAS